MNSNNKISISIIIIYNSNTIIYNNKPYFCKTAILYE